MQVAVRLKLKYFSSPSEHSHLFLLMAQFKGRKRTSACLLLRCLCYHHSHCCNCTFNVCACLHRWHYYENDYSSIDSTTPLSSFVCDMHLKCFILPAPRQDQALLCRGIRCPNQLLLSSQHSQSEQGMDITYEPSPLLLMDQAGQHIWPIHSISSYC